MDAKIKAKWVEALRSGKYQQGRKVLRGKSADGILQYCCIGVLADLLPSREWNSEDDGGGVVVDGYDEGNSALSLGSLRSVDLSDDAQWYLVGMNDEGKSFSEIADYIETHL